VANPSKVGGLQGSYGFGAGSRWCSRESCCAYRARFYSVKPRSKPVSTRVSGSSLPRSPCSDRASASCRRSPAVSRPRGPCSRRAEIRSPPRKSAPKGAGDPFSCRRDFLQGPLEAPLEGPHRLTARLLVTLWGIAASGGRLGALTPADYRSNLTPDHFVFRSIDVTDYA
jgi:hypothetical protein